MPAPGRTRTAPAAAAAALVAGVVAVPLLAPSAAAAPAAPAAAAPAAPALVASAAVGEVAYAQDFDDVADGALPAGWRAAAGSWAVQDGRLVGQPGSITRITFGPHLENYRLEATVRFDAVSNATRWLAAVLDIPASGAVPWSQAAMRTTTTAGNGIELAQRTAANTWDVPFTTPAPRDAGVGRDVRIAVEVQGGRATWLYEGQEVLSGRIARSADGVLGFSADGARVSIDDVVVTEIAPWTPVLDGDELPVTVAHRGYSSVTPENTLAAYEAAVRSGADYVEIDVQTDADGVPSVVHDNTVDRTTDGTGDLSTLPTRTVEGLDAGSWFSPAFVDEPLPTLAETLALGARGTTPMLLEIKGPETQAQVERIVDVVLASAMADRVVVQSFDTSILRWVKAYAPQLTTGYLGNVAADPVAHARELGVGLYNPSAASLATRLDAVEALNAAGIGVFVWTVDSAAQWRQFAEAGVDGVITNRPGAFVGWKSAVAQEQPAPAPADEPTVTVLAPTAAARVERGDEVVLAASATDADEVTLTLDGEPVANGASVPAADLAFGEHVLVARATGAGGTAEATTTFSVTVTAEGLRSRLAALPVTTGQLQQLLTALDARDWAGLTDRVTRLVPDEAVRAELVRQVEVLAAG
ncbi:glycerophosphodiester phosphodiesterase [Cellulomonas marina]|uniref:Glycerophosphoryl diester phosphodiesterase n=1 Tax=Cellulomonas marina TaxID=988821 RepID=A0A1I1ALV7_9CELL|nr:glycerophosphodiester phosphodiesterase family protein [Cellulomonas marina]GIG30176.1 hypothetical protein Cma02nite_27760 [Cellulomonas marina]SFB37313.1 glycerophosphoryl diester phosphodiesterase [Cellulomonas marina]